MFRKLTLFSLVLSLAVLTGCSLPFSTSSKVDKYLSEVTTIFNQSQTNLNQVGEDLIVDDFDKDKLKQNIDLLSQAIEEEESRYQEISQIDTPSVAHDLREKIDQYYNKQLEFLTESKELFEYLLVSEQYWNQDPGYISQLENIQYNNLSQLANKLENLANKARQDQEDLKDIKTNDTTSDYHDQLIKLYKGTADFFVELAQAVRDENIAKIDSAGKQLEDIASSASNAFTDLKITNKFSQYSDELNQLIQQIEQEIDKLRTDF